MEYSRMASIDKEIIWAVGFYDGEGHCGIHKIGNKPRAKRICVTLAQVELQPLERFRNAVGGKVNGPYNHYTNKNGKPYFQWTSWGTYKTTVEVFEKLRPYL